MTYSEALALDLILRTTDLPAKYYPTASELEVPTPGRRLKEWTLTSMRPLCETLQPQQSLAKRIVCTGFLFVHRSFFISALMEYPLNPMLSPYHKSLAVTLCCCSFLIRSFATYFEPWIEVFSRFWPKFTHIFSAAVMLGSFAIRSPFLAPGYVLEDLELTVRLYKKAALYATRARTSLVRNCLETPSLSYDNSDIGLAIPDEVARKGKIVDWNCIVSIAHRSIGERVGVA